MFGGEIQPINKRVDGTHGMGYVELQEYCKLVQPNDLQDHRLASQRYRWRPRETDVVHGSNGLYREALPDEHMEMYIQAD